MKRAQRWDIAWVAWNATCLALNLTFALIWGQWWSWVAAAVMAVALAISLRTIKQRKAATAVPSSLPNDPMSQIHKQIREMALRSTTFNVGGLTFGPSSASAAPKQPSTPSEFKGLPFDLAIGEVYGLRMWKMDQYGRLRARNWSSAQPWKPGVNVARCEARASDEAAYLYRMGIGPKPPSAAPGHPVPSESCQCGFYAYTSDQHAETQSYKGSHVVLGIVKGTGRTLLGTQGFRCEKAEIVALRDPTRGGEKQDPWRRQQLANLQRVYPDIPLFESRAALLEFAPLTETLPAPDSDEFWAMP